MEITCYICYENKKNIKTLECNHKICYGCYNNLIKCCCPFCRREFKKELPKKITSPIRILINYEPFSRVRRNMKRRRRKNLTFDEVLMRRKRIKKRCRRKWMKKNRRKNKMGA